METFGALPRSFHSGSFAWKFVLVVLDVASLVATVRGLAAGSDNAGIRYFLVIQALIAFPIMAAATSEVFTTYCLDSDSLTKKPPLRKPLVLSVDGIESVALRRTMGVVLEGCSDGRPVRMKWVVRGDGKKDDMIALLLDLSRGSARAAMDPSLLRLLHSIEVARGYTQDELAALKPSTARAIRALRQGRFADFHVWVGRADPEQTPQAALEALAVMRELGTV